MLSDQTKQSRRANMPITNYILNLLGIKDNNIVFSNKQEQIKVKDVIYQKLFASLTYEPLCCQACGTINDKSIIKYGFKTSNIKLLPTAGNPCFLSLKKQRFLCKECNQTFTASTNIVDEHCYISNQIKQHILCDLTKKISEKDIAHMNFVSHSTVSRCIDQDFKSFSPDLNHLPENLCFDEFKSTKDAKGAMSFIFCDAKTHDVIDIVENRQFYFLQRYFLRFKKNARLNVKTVCIDMYTPYIKLIKMIFPNAHIVFDRFHIVNLLSRSMSKTRVQAMKKFSVYSMEYKRLKRYWKLIQMDSDKLNYVDFKYYVHFRTWKYSYDVVQESISADSVLKRTYVAYQLLLTDIKNKDCKLLKKHLLEMKESVSPEMNVSINTLLENFSHVENALKFSYSNGCLEGINNYIKVLKRIAFGYKSFFHFRNRILISKKLMIPKKENQEAYSFAS